MADRLQLVDAKTVGDCLGLEVSTVRKWARLGRLPCYRLGRRVCFDLDEIAEKLKAEHYSPARSDLGGH